MSVPRRAMATIDLDAIEHNAATLCAILANGSGEAGLGAGPTPGGAQLCAVVKADGYGHGAVAAARAALRGGASWLAVAGSLEALALREAGLSGVRVLVMGALSAGELDEALAADADVVVWRERDVDAVSAAGGGRVHVKLDTGMGRLGTRDVDQADAVVAAAARADGVELAGIMTHFATSDQERDDGFFEGQLALFREWAAAVKQAHPEAIAHAANSAALMRTARAHLDMVRCGIALYGIDPFGVDGAARSLRPALELRSWVAEVKRLQAGDSAGYGRRFVAEADTHLGVVPLGYGDGWRRALSGAGHVLIDNAKHPVVGTISMDNLTVDLGPDPAAMALVGSEAVLIGRQGPERVLAEDVARELGTIGYEVTCGLTARVARVYQGVGAGGEG